MGFEVRPSLVTSGSFPYGARIVNKIYYWNTDGECDNGDPDFKLTNEVPKCLKPKRVIKKCSPEKPLSNF